MKHIKTRFDKHDIPNLDKVTFEGRIITVVSPGEAERAVNYLLSQPILGLDTETRPSFRPGSGMNKVALLQVSTLDTCFLFRLNQMGMPPCIIRLLEDTSVIKVGLSWHDDIMQLRRRVDFTPGTFVELQQMVSLIGVKDLSLAKIYANLFGYRISKTQRLTNWEADILTQPQKVYAATDAWACIQIYNEINRLHDTNDFELEIIPEPEPPQVANNTDNPPVEVKVEKKKKRRYRKKNNITPAEKNATNAVGEKGNSASSSTIADKQLKTKSKRSSTLKVAKKTVSKTTSSMKSSKAGSTTASGATSNAPSKSIKKNVVTKRSKIKADSSQNDIIQSSINESES